VRTILLHQDPITNGGVALWRDHHGHIRAMRDDNDSKHYPWR
jgi:hypothetical protein